MASFIRVDFSSNKCIVLEAFWTYTYVIANCISLNYGQFPKGIGGW